MFAMRKQDGRKLSVLDRKASVQPRSGSLRSADSSMYKSSIMAVASVIQRPSLDMSPNRAETADGILQMQESIESTNEVMCLRFSPDCTILAAGLSDGVIKIYAADNLQLTHTLTRPDITKSNLPCTGIRYIAGKRFEKSNLSIDAEDKTRDYKSILIGSYTSGWIRFWHIPTSDCIFEINEGRPSGQTMAVALNSTANTFASVGADQQIFVYDLDTRKRINILEASDERDKMDGHKARVFAIHFHPVDPFLFLTGGWDDTVQYWDVRKPRSFRRIFGPHICGDALDLDPNTNQILTGSWRREKPLEVWDFASANKIADIPDEFGGFSLLYCAQWFGKDYIVCGGTQRNRARVIDRKSMNAVGTLGELPQGVYCLDNDRAPTLNKLHIAVGALKKVYLLKTTNPTAITMGSRRASVLTS